MIRLGVDSFNLAADSRGMGRVVRQTLQSLERLGQTELVYIVRDRAASQAVNREFAGKTILPGELARERLDAVWYPWNGMRFAPRTRSVVTIHDPFAFTFAHREFIARWREQSPIRRAIKSADRILTVSNWTATELLALFPIDKTRIRVVPNAIDPFWHAVETSVRKPYMLVLAGPEERKNIPMLLRAYYEAFEGAGPKLIVAGTLRDQDERSFEKMRAWTIRMHPTDEQLRELYSGAFAVLIPSLAEGFGLTALEAMACGAAVIASSTSALPETCEGAAMLVRPDENAWRGALRTITLDEDVRRDLQRRSIERAGAVDPNGPAKALTECIQELLGAPS